MRSARTCALLLAASVLPCVGLAQVPGTCQPQLDSARMGRHIEIAPGQFHPFGAGGVFARCVDQPTTMQADSVAWFSERDLMIRVVAAGRDPETTPIGEVATADVVTAALDHAR